MRYLVTGGCGFIGAHLCDALIRNGDQVLVLDDFSTGIQENLADGAELLVGDVTSPITVQSAMSDVDGCFHLAAVSSVQRSVDDWLETHRINQQGTVNILNAARAKGGRAPIPVVFASSAAVYGDNATQPLSELATPRPISAYGADKLGSEIHARVAWITHRVPNVSLRLFNVYGPGQRSDSLYSGVISVFIDRLSKDQSLIIYGDGRQMRDFVYVGDVVRYFQSAMNNLQTGTHVYNVCSGYPTSVGQLAQILSIVSGVSVEIEHREMRTGDISISLGNSEKATTMLGIETEVELGEGLRLTYEAMMRSKGRYQQVALC